MAQWIRNLPAVQETQELQVQSHRLPIQAFVFFSKPITPLWGFSDGSDGKESACNVGDLGSILGSGKSAGEGMATHSSIFAWRIPWTEEPGRLQSMGLQRVGHDWAINTNKDWKGKRNVQVWERAETRVARRFYSGAGRLPWTLPPLQWPSGLAVHLPQGPSSQETDTGWPSLSHLCQAEARPRQGHNKATWNEERVSPQGAEKQGKEVIIDSTMPNSFLFVSNWLLDSPLTFHLILLLTKWFSSWTKNDLLSNPIKVYNIMIWYTYILWNAYHCKFN